MRYVKQDALGNVIPAPRPPLLRRIIRLVDRPKAIRPKTKLSPLAAKLLAVGMTKINQIEQVK